MENQQKPVVWNMTPQDVQVVVAALVELKLGVAKKTFDSLEKAVKDSQEPSEDNTKEDS